MTHVTSTGAMYGRPAAGPIAPRAVLAPAGSASATSAPPIGAAARTASTAASYAARSAAMKARTYTAPALPPSPAPPAPGSTPTAGLRGDIDGDGSVTVMDSKALLEYLFGGVTPAALANADVNEDGQVDVSDAVRLLDMVQTPAPAPATPRGSTLATLSPGQPGVFPLSAK